jgi:adrenodoxin-NADP+ reductase
VGRRGPLQAAFTIAELREMLKLENCKTYWRPEDFKGIQDSVLNLARPRKRLTELMLKSIQDSSLDTRKCDKEFHPIFLRGPLEFLGSNSIESVKLSINELEGDNVLKQTAKPTGEFEEISCGLVFKSIGYKSTQIDPSVPFDLYNGRILNSSGKVEKGLYTAGWVATGPVGVILSTMNNAFSVGQLISKEIELFKQLPGRHELQKQLQIKGISVVNYKGWKKIDKEECERGKKMGKPREKIVDISEMMEIACN